jgi:hypothetical protein
VIDQLVVRTAAQEDSRRVHGERTGSAKCRSATRR